MIQAVCYMYAIQSSTTVLHVHIMVLDVYSYFLIKIMASHSDQKLQQVSELVNSKFGVNLGQNKLSRSYFNIWWTVSANVDLLLF